MKWQVPGAAAAGLLLTLPLMLTLGAVLLGPRPRDTSAHARVSPMLSAEERRSLLTLERPCQRREDCEPPLGCLRFTNTQAFCLASECRTDVECETGFTCQPLATLGEGPLVRHCVALGKMREGEPCSPYPLRQEEGCERGLLCQHGHCGRPCRVEEPSSCPEGFACREGRAGPSCMPVCEGRQCPEGQRCVRFPDGGGVCGVIHGQDCQRTPCPEGQSCEVRYSPGRPGHLKLQCLQRCEAQPSSCAAGTVCYFGECRTPCQPEASGACGPGEACVLYPGERLWLCDVRDR